MTTHTKSLPLQGSPRRIGSWVGAIVALGLASTLQAATLTSTPSFDPAERVVLTAGRSTVLTTDFDITRVALTDPSVADVSVVTPRELLIDGKKPGTISLFIWGEGRREDREIVIEAGVSVLQQRMRDLFPGENIQVSVADEAIVLSGTASTNVVTARAVEIAEASAPKSKVINMLQLPGGAGSQQVMLQVRFAEVNSKAMTELGASLFAARSKFAARTSTQQFAAPEYDDKEGGADEMTFSDFLNLFYFQRNEGIGAVVKALKQNGNFQSLAEPNLIAYSGQEASFLAGGEFPVPVVQGATGTVSIMFKEFGVRLRFKPTITGDVIRLHVRPEVSSLDFSNGVTLQGFRIPSLSTRYAETEVELRDGQSFAIAGLLDNLEQADRSGIPILSQIPIIGNLFKSKATRSERTELMVLITPRLVRPLNPDQVPPLPTTFKEKGGGGAGLGALLEGAGLVDSPLPQSKPAAGPVQPAASKKQVQKSSR
ncbi:MAG: type II and III secretion system protein family protein [Acidobacteria bacterium]|jgi:pilus assembly protein CpaC|nr:type II and III secretion system protein family protein [Acidobacteriota bacterium]